MEHKKRANFKKAANPFATLWRILNYMSVYKWRLALVVLCVLISSGAAVASNYFIRPLINDYILPMVGQSPVDFSNLARLIGLMATFYAAGVVASYFLNRLMVEISVAALSSIRNEMFEHMQKLPISFFDAHTHGELMSRYTNDTDSLRQLLREGLVQLVSAAVGLFSTVVVMLILSPILTALAAAIVTVMVLIVKFLGKKSGTYFRSQQKIIGDANGYIEEMISGQKVVKVFSYEGKAKERFNTLNSELFTSAEGASTYASMLMPILVNLSYTHYALTAMAGGLLTIVGMLDLGTLASFLQYTRSLAQPISQLSQQFHFVMHALAGAEHIFALLDQLPEQDNGTVTLVHAQRDTNGHLIEACAHTGIWAWKHANGDDTSYTELCGDVRFQDVTFGYEAEKTVLHDLSLYAKPGQKIAFVGSTGAGKTTITNLINRFYEVDAGRILYDGIDIKNICRNDLRRSLAMVLQDTHLFSGSVMDNIRYGKLEASDEEVVHAAKLANAHSFIRHLPEGYRTILTGDGANLSQGQRQLLSIARAALADPPVLILDEATSSIDTRTEALIECGMDQLMQGRTVFVIAHRLSTVRNSNAIMVLEDGRIIERGDHDDLLKQRGMYYRLYTGTFELS